MKAVFSAAQLGHAPSRFLSKGHIVSYPESPERARALLEGARQAGADIFASRRYGEEAFLSVHNPRYVVFVLLDQPHGTKETGGFALAGWTAAPTVGRVIQRIAPLLGVPNVPPPPTKLASTSPSNP